MDGEVEYDSEWSTVHLVINTLLSATFAGLVAVLVTAAIERWVRRSGGHDLRAACLQASRANLRWCL